MRVGPTPAADWHYAAQASGFLDFTGLAKGYYYAVFLVNNGYQEISARVPFSVGSLISTVSMEASEIQQGNDFTVHFGNGPGIPKDWIGIFKEGAELVAAQGHFVHVHVDRATQRPVDIPARTREALNALA